MTEKLFTETLNHNQNKTNKKIIIWHAKGVPQLNNIAHPKHPREEETSSNRNHIITSKQQHTNKLSLPEITDPLPLT